MIRTIEAVIDQQGKVHLLENIQLPEAHRALVTILEEEKKIPKEVTALSEKALAKDWNKKEEDIAWQH